MFLVVSERLLSRSRILFVSQFSRVDVGVESWRMIKVG